MEQRTDGAHTVVLGGHGRLRTERGGWRSNMRSPAPHAATMASSAPDDWRKTPTRPSLTRWHPLFVPLERCDNGLCNSTIAVGCGSDALRELEGIFGARWRMDPCHVSAPHPEMCWLPVSVPAVRCTIRSHPSSALVPCCAPGTSSTVGHPLWLGGPIHHAVCHRHGQVSSGPAVGDLLPASSLWLAQSAGAQGPGSE